MQGGLATVINARRPLAAKVTQVGAATWDPVPVGVITSMDPDAPRVLALSGEDRKQLAASLEEEAQALQDHIDETVTYGEAPWKIQAYPLTPRKREAMERILKKQLSRSMIFHSCSPYALPAFLVGKVSGGHRLVIDTRRLNRHIQKSSYPPPRIHDILNRLAGYSFFNSIDLAAGFHQIALELERQKYFKAASQTAKPDGPGAGHDLHENLLVPDCFVYIDDILAAGRTSEERLFYLASLLAPRVSVSGAKLPKLSPLQFALCVIAAPLYRLLEMDKRITWDWNAGHNFALDSLSWSVSPARPLTLLVIMGSA